MFVQPLLQWKSNKCYIQGGPKVDIEYIVNYCIPTFGPHFIMSMSVALGIQNEMRMRHIVICGL